MFNYAAVPLSLQEIRSQISQRLSQEDYQELKQSGLTDEQILATGHHSLQSAKEALQLTGIRHRGLCFNYADPMGNPYPTSGKTFFYRIKPRDWHENSCQQIDIDNDPPKYLSPPGEGNKPYFSALHSWGRTIKRSKVTIDEVEGEKKADCLCGHGIPAIGLPGVYGWLDKTARHSELAPEENSNSADTIVLEKKLPISRVLPELAVVDYSYRQVNIAFDSDVVHKPQVRSALYQRAIWLHENGAYPHIVLLPNELDGSKNGPDDLIVRHGIEAYQLLRSFAFPALSGKADNPSLNFPSDPKLPLKVAMTWCILKDHWRFRPGVGWYQWQGSFWQLRSPDEFEQDLIDFMNQQQWQEQHNSAMSSLVRQLRSKLLIRNEHWNPADKLAFANGVLNVSTGEFTNSHSREDFITCVLPYEYTSTASCPTWLNFLNEALAGDTQAIELLQAFFKWILLPKPSDRKVELEKNLDLVGPPGTGKGTVLEMIEALVGSENCGAVGKMTFSSPAGLANLLDKKVSIDRDASGFLADVGLFNKVVSNEPIPLKRLYKDVIDARLRTVLVRAYNRFLDTPDGAEGLNRRIIALAFNNTPKNIDINLRANLQEELPGIFAWAWSVPTAEMKRRILWAGSVDSVADASIRRFEANNPEYVFLSETFPRGSEVQMKHLYSSYVEWCKETGHQSKKLRKFSEVVQTLGCIRSEKTMGCYFYTIPVMNDFDVIGHLGIARPSHGEFKEFRDNQGELGTVDVKTRDNQTLTPQGIGTVGTVEAQNFSTQKSEPIYLLRPVVEPEQSAEEVLAQCPFKEGDYVKEIIGIRCGWIESLQVVRKGSPREPFYHAIATVRDLTDKCFEIEPFYLTAAIENESTEFACLISDTSAELTDTLVTAELTDTLVTAETCDTSQPVKRKLAIGDRIYVDAPGGNTGQITKKEAGYWIIDWADGRTMHYDDEDIQQLNIKKLSVSTAPTSTGHDLELHSRSLRSAAFKEVLQVASAEEIKRAIKWAKRDEDTKRVEALQKRLDQLGVSHADGT